MPIQTREQFIAAYESNYADLIRYVRRRFDAAGVDDVVAETFTIAWRRRSSLPDPLRPWLFKTASNVMKGMNRSSTYQQRWADIEPQSQAGLSIDEVLDLRAAWRAMNIRDREVLALSFWEELTDTEAAAALGCTRATFSMRLTRAKRRFRDSVQTRHSHSTGQTIALQSKDSTLRGTK